MNNFSFSRCITAFTAALVALCTFLFAACVQEESWQAISHKTYYNNQQTKIVAQKQSQIAVYDATSTAKSLLLGWRAAEDASWSAASVSFDGIVQTTDIFVEEFIDGDNNLYHAVKIRTFSPTIVKVEVSYKPDTLVRYEYNLTDIMAAINSYATEKDLNLFQHLQNEI